MNPATQDNIDNALEEAQQAVATLAEDVDRLAAGTDAPLAAPPGKAPARPGDRGAAAALDRRTASIAPSDPRVARILKLRVPVSVRVAQRRKPLSEILKIVPGTIIEFDRGVEQELDLMIGGRQIGSGIAVKAGERFGLRVTRIAELSRRIESLGREPAPQNRPRPG